jgi:hypothetical protein
MAMVIRDVCPRCKSPKYKKNGHIHNGKQNHQCKDCGREFIDCFEQHLVSDGIRALIERLLLERITLRGICRAVGVKPTPFGRPMSRYAPIGDQGIEIRSVKWKFLLCCRCCQAPLHTFFLPSILFFTYRIL